MSAPGPIRTADLSLRRRALYPLSYGRRERHESDIPGSQLTAVPDPAANALPLLAATVATMDLSLFFLGTAGSVPSARRGLPGLLVRRGGEKLLFDCGEGTQRQLLRSVGLPDLDAIFVTHFHADHWLGLPGMLKSFALRDRTAPLAVYGPQGLGELMEAMRVVVYGRLPYELSDRRARAGGDRRA